MTREIDTSCAIERTTSPYMDGILGHAYPVLDHGFSRIIDYMGDDLAIKHAAQTSYRDGANKLSTGLGVLSYLMRHAHTSPFEMCELKIHQQMPLFVARQMVRHRTAKLNEFSGRYSIMPELFYVPELDRIQRQSTDNKQGSGDSFDPEDAMLIQSRIQTLSEKAFKEYQTMVLKPEDGGFGLAKELARIILPQNIYTQWYWKMDLHNLFHMLMLRMDSHSQWEIQQYAQAIWLHVQQWVPVSAKAFEVYRVNSSTFSQRELSALALLVDNDESRSMMDALHKMDVETIAQQSQGEFSQGEWKEFLLKLDKLATKLVK